MAEELSLNEHTFIVDSTLAPICRTVRAPKLRIMKDDVDFQPAYGYQAIDPETDSAAQLLNYSKKFPADGKRWIFLTGEKPKLYKLARKGYLLDAREGNGGAEDFIYTQNFALIDKKKAEFVGFMMEPTHRQ